MVRRLCDTRGYIYHDLMTCTIRWRLAFNSIGNRAPQHLVSRTLIHMLAERLLLMLIIQLLPISSFSLLFPFCNDRACVSKSELSRL